MPPCKGGSGQSLNGLGGASNQGETSQRNNTIHQALSCGEEVLVEVDGEVETGSEHGDHLATTALALLDNAHLLGVVLGHQVGSLQHQTNGRTSLRQLRASVVPLVVSASVNMFGARVTTKSVEVASG